MSLLGKARLFLATRRYAFRQTFAGPYADIVLKDLATFCFANQSTFNVNDRAHVLAEGRREVWLRIANHLNMTPDQLWALYDGRADV